MPRATDYYKLLGVGTDASVEEIHRAYRRLARRYHPDTGAGAEQHAHFHELSDAYEVLRDPVQRARYDRLRLATRGGPSRRQSPASAASPAARAPSSARPSSRAPLSSAGPSSRDVPRFVDEEPGAVDVRLSLGPLGRVRFTVRRLRP